MSKKKSFLLKRIVSKVIRRIKRFVLFDKNQIIYNGKSYSSYWDGCYKDADHSFFRSVIVKGQARRAFLRGGFRPDEFFLYGLESKNNRARDLYFSQAKKDQILISFYGRSFNNVLDVLKDKYVFYSYLKDFFNRDVTYIKSSDDRLAFLSFCCQHNSVFAKLNKGNCGRGARILSINNEEQANVLFDELISSGEWIVEELIKQDSSISQFNASSINTIRFPSFKKNGKVKSVFPCMRFGREGSIVDNAGQGGVFVSIDYESGEIITDAFDEKGNVFPSHPDSKVRFRGFRIPRWEELKGIVEKAHLALPDDQVYVAFDFALSERGWCIVEGNWGDWILEQVSLRRGMKQEFVSLLQGEW